MKKDELDELEHKVRNNLMAMAYHITCLKKAISRIERVINDEVKKLNSNSQN